MRATVFAILCLCALPGVAGARLLKTLTLRDAPKADPVSGLRQDAFFKQWWPAGTPKAKTASDSCDGWKGSGFLCWIEYPIWQMMQKHVPQDATIAEFGARFGTTTCAAARLQGNSGKLMAVEPDARVSGDLMANLQSHDCHSRVLRGVLGSRPLVMEHKEYGGRTLNVSNSSADSGSFVQNFDWDAVEKASGLRFDALIVDCEGCFPQMLKDFGPKFHSQVNVIVLEAEFDCERWGQPETIDWPVEPPKKEDCIDYKKVGDTLAENGLKMVEKRNDCDFKGASFPKCNSYINHYVFRRA